MELAAKVPPVKKVSQWLSQLNVPDQIEWDGVGGGGGEKLNVI